MVLQSTPFFQSLEPRMNLRQLRYFVAVAEELHFGRAAVRLHISQPPLSQQIRNLEDILGVSLFKRDKKRIELTFAGQVFLDSARKLLEQSQWAIQTVRRAAKGEVGTLVIGYASSIPFSGLIGRVVREFRRQRPDVQLRIKEMRAIEQIQALLERDIDIGFVREPLRQTHPQVESRCVYREAFVVAMPTDHPLSNTPSVRLADLRHDAFVLYPRDSGTVLYDQVIHLCHGAGFFPNVIQETPQFASVLDLVSAGLGVTIVPASTAQSSSPLVRFCPISDTVEQTAVSMIYRKEETSAALGAFLALAQQAAPAG
jgi:DNA-binding transcriptional LysR family regulator